MNFLLILLLQVLVIVDGQLIGNRIVDKSASCDDNFLYFTIQFERPFVGLIYTDGEYGNLRCTYVNGSSFSAGRYNITIPLTDCRTQRYPNGTRQNNVIVQKDTRLLESTDQLFLLTCTPAVSNAAGGYGPNQRFTLSFLGITVQGPLASTEVVTNSPAQASANVDYTVEVRAGSGPDGRPIDRPLSVGEPISYVIRLKNLHNTDARIGRCWATDGVSEIQLSDDDGCSLQPNNNIWNPFQTTKTDAGRVLYNNIKTWAFPTSNRVNILCNLHICPSVCAATACSSGRLRILLRKRQLDVGDESSESESENSTIRVEGEYRVAFEALGTDSAQVLAASRTVNTSLDDSSELNSGRKICLSRTIFIAAVVLLLFIIVLTFAFVVFMLIYMFRLVRRRRRARQRERRFREGRAHMTLCSSSHSGDKMHKLRN